VLMDSHLESFRAAAPAVIGCTTTLLLIVYAVFGCRRTGVNMLPDYNAHQAEAYIFRMAMYVCTILLILCGFFHFFGTEWLIAYQTVFLSILGFYAVRTMDSEHIFIYFVSSVINWFCISGGLHPFGYSSGLVELTTYQCTNYFGSPTNSRCETGGFLNFLRVVGLAAVILQGAAVYVSFRLWKSTNNGPMNTAGSRYESIDEAKAKSAQPTYTYTLSSLQAQAYQSETPIGGEETKLI